MKTFCDHYNDGKCRSCDLIELSHADQILKKEKILKRALRFFPDIKLEPSVTGKLTGFRNKAKMAVTGSSRDSVIGITGSSTLDEGQALLDCAVHHPRLNLVLARMPDYIRTYDLIPYRIAEKVGELKSLILFYSEESDEMYLRFVLRSKECVSRIKKLLPGLQKEFPFITCVSANLQPIPHAILEGPEEIYITEQASIRHLLDKLELTLLPKAFVQTNTEISTKLYLTAAQWASELKPKIFMELFAGQGAFSFFAAGSSAQLIGVEINPDAVQTANETAARLWFSQVSFVAADAGQVQSLVSHHSPDLLLVNPPRKGLGPNGVQLILQTRPPAVIYSSCSVESLAQDLQLLAAEYNISKAQIFDLFPNTSHFETLVLISRRDLT